jgi:PhoH-like ATPase
MNILKEKTGEIKNNLRKSDIMGKAVLDTNVLLESPEILEEFDGIILPSAVLEEIDGLKKAEGSLGMKAREANRKIEKNKKKIEFVIKDIYIDMPDGWDESKRDNKIVMCALENKARIISNDINVRLKAEAVGVKSQGWYKDKEEYKGYKSVKLNTCEINELYNKLNSNVNKLELLTNQYIEIINSDLKEKDSGYRTELRFDGEKLVPLKLPPSKVLKGWNVQQRFALDLLNNKDIPIKIINGKHGSGKTALAVKMGVHLLEKGNYGSLTFWRTPVPADDIEIGFLPGSKQEKIESYMKPMLQYVEKDDAPFYLDNLLREEKINMDVVSFLKGLNVEDSYVIFDECEDLSVKLIKLAGTRIARNSCIVFTGDYKQAENRFKNNNGITTFIDKAKGNPLVGIVILDDDVRSEASKVFADLI